MVRQDYQRFENLTFDDFRNMASDTSLSPVEKIGFPKAYREGKEHLIFEDIVQKLPLLSSTGKTILDIGPGCSDLPGFLIDLCRKNNHHLILIDSEEMLNQLPDESFITKIAGYYPYCEGLVEQYQGQVDVILTYSVLHYIFVESNLWAFVDRSLQLLAHGGQMLIGDIPNLSKRKRFFSTPNGIRFHQEFMQTHETPDVQFNQVEYNQIDDSVVISLLMRIRQQGADGYVVPQRPDLPMANRREDILILKP